MLYPDLEILWVGEHLAEKETRQILAECFKQVTMSGKSFNVTFCYSATELQEKLKKTPRIVGQILSNRVIAVTSEDKWKGVHKMINECLSHAKLIDAKSVKPAPALAGEKETKSPSTGSAAARNLSIDIAKCFVICLST